MLKMKKILLAVISLLPVLTYGQSMKIDPKQLMPGADGNVIITRNGVNTLDNIDWSDINNIPTDLERTSNKVTNLNSPDNTTYPTTQAVATSINVTGSFRYKGSIASGGNLNDYIEEGNYSAENANVASLVNAPADFPSGTALDLLVFKGRFDKYVTQFASPVNMGGDYVGMWVRTGRFNGTLWSRWIRMADRDWVTAQNYLTAETDPVYTADKPNIIFSGDNNSLLNNDAGYITSSAIPAAQTLSINGHDLSLSGGGGTVTIPDNNTTYSAGTGLSLSGTTFNNTAPDQTVTLTNGTGISVSGTYPNFTITNTAPNQSYTLPTASASVLGGVKVGSRLSIASGVLSADNMMQNLSLSGQTLSISGGNSVTLPTLTEVDPVYTADKPNIVEYKGSNPGTDAYAAENGTYYMAAYIGSNSPDPTNYGSMTMLKANSRFIALYARQNSSVRPKIAWGIEGGSTSSWHEIAFADDIPTVNNSTLTLATSGIASGSQTFTANSSSDKTFTVNVPATNLGGSYSIGTGDVTVTSSTGTPATINVPIFRSNNMGAMTVGGAQGFTTEGNLGAGIEVISTTSATYDIGADGKSVYTIIVKAEDCTLVLPDPANKQTGRILRLVYYNPTGGGNAGGVTISGYTYINYSQAASSSLTNGSLVLQSDGEDWYQVGGQTQ